MGRIYGLRFARATILVFLFLTGCSIPSDESPGEGQGLITIEEEKQLGYYMASLIDRKYLPLENEKVRTAITEIGLNITRNIPVENFAFSFKILNNPNENAFAIPGGTIYITTGLLEKLKNKDQVAAVLAHEIAHITARHPARALQNAQVATGVLATLSLSTAIGMAAARQPQAAADMARITTVLLTTIVYQGYSREYELQADRLGLNYMKRAGNKPDAMVEVLNILIEVEHQKAKKRPSDRPPELLSSHPNLETRIEALQRLLQNRGEM